jgi:two-component system, OmpR family, sensor kinase
VVPQLASNLRARQLDDMATSAKASRATLQGLMGRPDIAATQLDSRVRSVADTANARVTLLGVQQSQRPDTEGEPPPTYVITDSREERRVPSNAPLALRAVDERRVVRGESRLDGERLGQVAQPLFYRGQADWVAVYSRSLDDVDATVSFIRDRVLVATGVALLVALIGGYLVARALSRRVGRLERAAQRVAAGEDIEPLPVDSEDELGQLTRTFNDMQRQLRQVDVARKEFVATASHELRTPIFSLGGFVELLQDEDLDDETRAEFVEAMREQVDRLQKLAMDLLDLSRLDAGSVELASERTDLVELAESVVREFTPVLTRHRTDLEVRLPDTPVEASCDPDRVVQIMRILLDNALRHTPEGTHVTVSVTPQNGVAQFTVADLGPGLPDGAAAKVFERFYTADATSGAGLGLAIALELAGRMGGSVSLGPRRRGTAFTLTLPGVPAGTAGEPATPAARA